MAITKEQKADILNDLVDKFSRSKSVIFSDYRGVDVAGIQDLRGRLREKGAEAKIAKKTLMKLAAEKSDLPEITDEIFTGPVAATFSYEDELSGLQVLFKFSKENDNLKLLGGIIDGKLVGADEINQLAKLPSRDELLAKMIGSMNAPVSGFVGIMNNLVSGFVRVLSAYKDTLPADDTAKTSAPQPEADQPMAEEGGQAGDAVGTQGMSREEPRGLASAEPGETKEEPKPAPDTDPEEEAKAEEAPVAESAEVETKEEEHADASSNEAVKAPVDDAESTESAEEPKEEAAEESAENTSEEEDDEK